MRRMYSVQELSEIVSAVVGQKIEDGSFDEVMAGAVDDYLTEHPVDITALEGLDISVKSITATDGIDIAQLVDSSGHDRFVTEEITLETITGVTKTYGKWSLSGTHLLIVLGLSIDDATTLAEGTKLCSLNLPAWMEAKIVPLFGSIISRYVGNIYNPSTGSAQEIRVNLRKDANSKSILDLTASLTTTALRNARIAFDLLID